MARPRVGRNLASYPGGISRRETRLTGPARFIGGMIISVLILSALPVGIPRPVEASRMPLWYERERKLTVAKPGELWTWMSGH